MSSNVNEKDKSLSDIYQRYYNNISFAISAFIRSGGLGEFTASEFRLLITLASFANNKNWQCYPSRDVLMKCCGYSKNTHTTALKGLQTKDLVRVTSRYSKQGANTNLYQINRELIMSAIISNNPKRPQNPCESEKANDTTTECKKAITTETSSQSVENKGEVITKSEGNPNELPAGCETYLDLIADEDVNLEEFKDNDNIYLEEDIQYMFEYCDSTQARIARLEGGEKLAQWKKDKRAELEKQSLLEAKKIMAYRRDLDLKYQEFCKFPAVYQQYIKDPPHFKLKGILEDVLLKELKKDFGNFTKISIDNLNKDLYNYGSRAVNEAILEQIKKKGGQKAYSYNYFRNYLQDNYKSRGLLDDEQTDSYKFDNQEYDYPEVLEFDSRCYDKDWNSTYRGESIYRRQERADRQGVGNKKQ